MLWENHIKIQLTKCRVTVCIGQVKILCVGNWVRPTGGRNAVAYRKIPAGIRIPFITP